MQQELANSLTMRRGHFRLESGHHGDLWLDLDRLFVRPATLLPFAHELAKRLATHEIAAICGPLTGGAFVAQMIAADLAIEFYFAERLAHPERAALYTVEYRVPESLRAALNGTRVAIVDDAISAGSALRATLADLEACGAHPIAIGALLVLGARGAQFAASRRLPLEALAHLPSQTWEPSQCPLCHAGVALEDLT